MGNIVQARDVVLCNPKMDGNEKKWVLSNIKTEWKSRVVMTNSSVTAGLDFDVENCFYGLYACVSGFMRPRGIVLWIS
jgi:hypothetical protein